MENAWNYLEANQRYATGGWGPNETFIEPHKGQLFDSLHSTADHFETPCGSYAAIKLARYLLCATGDARYGDGLERVLFNGTLAIKEPDADGDYPYYSTYGKQTQKVYYPKKWPCCSGTLVEGVADYVKNIYFRAADGVAVNLYTPSQLRWSERCVPVTLTQETSYPLGDTVTLHMFSRVPVEYTIRLRIPGWLATEPLLTINGARVATTMRSGFALVHRRWGTNDTLTLRLPHDFRTEPIDNQHKNTVALLRGPLVYVELDPPASNPKLPQPATLRAESQTTGAFTTQSSSIDRRFVPFYFVRDEIYSLYTERS